VALRIDPYQEVEREVLWRWRRKRKKVEKKKKRKFGSLVSFFFFEKDLQQCTRNV